MSAMDGSARMGSNGRDSMGLDRCGWVWKGSNGI